VGGVLLTNPNWHLKTCSPKKVFTTKKSKTTKWESLRTTFDLVVFEVFVVNSKFLSQFSASVEP
jgi:hypothetical protein